MNNENNTPVTGTLTIGGRVWRVTKVRLHRLDDKMRWWCKPVGFDGEWKSAGTTIAERDEILANVPRAWFAANWTAVVTD